MKLKFIPDEERNFNKDDEKDFLEYSNYVSNLKDIISNAPDTSFTIGLFGGWGSGKSSIINTVKDNFKDEKIKFITYDAWKYSDDSFRRTFLTTISKDPECNPPTNNKYSFISKKLNLKSNDYEFLNSKFYNDIQKEVSTQFKINYFYLILISISVGISLLFMYTFGIKYPEKSSDLVAIAALFISIISLSKYYLKTQIYEHFVFAPEQFDACFKKLIDYIYTEHNKKYNKIVFVIDNLDRCSGFEVIEKLKTIKTFLSDCENIIFLIPLDDYALKKYLFKLGLDETNKNGSENNQDFNINVFVNEFLRKIFDVSLRIKKINNLNIKEYGDQIQRKHDLEFSEDTLFLISDTFVNNPRRIIQFFNNLQVELNNYEQDFRDEYETYICKILIINEEYPNIYRYLSNHFTDAMNLNLIEKDNSKEELKYFGTEFDDFIEFNRRTSYVLNINEVKTFNKIFYNSEGFKDLPKDINDAINSNNYDQIDKFCTKDENKENLLRLLCFSIEDNYHKQSSTVINRINLLLHLYKNATNATKFPESIEKILKNMMDQLIDKSDEFKTLLIYSKNTKDDSYNSLIYHIISAFNEEFKGGNKNKNVNISCLKEILNVFPENENVLHRISKSIPYIFVRDNENKDEILDFFDSLTPTQLKKTYTYPLVDYSLIDLSKFDLALECLNYYLDVLNSNAKRYIIKCIHEKLEQNKLHKINTHYLERFLKKLKEDPSLNDEINSLEHMMMLKYKSILR